MADMPSDFWAGWIAVITVVSLLALAWLIFSIYFTGNAHDQEQSPVWDETLSEGSNPAPMWWFWLILAAMVFSVIYLMLYPGLGSFKGALKWSQGHRLDHSIRAYESQFGPARQEVARAQLHELQSDPNLMASAQRTFDRNCGICHGQDGRGQARRFPDLLDADWQWGSDVQQIEHSIRHGRKAAMPGWGGVLGEEGVRNVAAYVRLLNGSAAGRAGHAGEAQYKQFCLACHGAGGEGNPMLGAPNLADDIWLYGDSDAELLESVAKGRNGEMPAFDKRMDETQMRLLLAWLTKKP